MTHPIRFFGLMWVMAPAVFAWEDASFVPPREFRVIQFAASGQEPPRQFEAVKFEESETLCESNELRVMFPLASPPTLSTPTHVAGLFVLTTINGNWKIKRARVAEIPEVEGRPQ